MKKHTPENTCNIDGNKKSKPRKGQNNGLKKQVNSENQETVIAQKYYISSLEGKINHLENTVNVLQKALESQTLNQNIPTENNISQNQQLNQKQCSCTASEDMKYRLLENRLLILENNSQVMNAMYVQNQMRSVLNERQSMGNTHVPQPMPGIQPTAMNYAPVLTPTYPQYFQRPGVMNQHYVQPVPSMPVLHPVQPPVIPVPINQQHVVYPAATMTSHHVRQPVIPAPVNQIHSTAPPNILHAATGHVRVNLQTTSVPTDHGNPQYFVPGPVQSAVRVNKEQSRVQQPLNPQPTPIAKQTERKRPHRPSDTEDGNGLSPTKISKVASTIDLGLTPERSESPQPTIRTDSHHDPTETEHKQNGNSSSTEYKLNDFLRIPGLSKAPPDMENMELELRGEITRL